MRQSSLFLPTLREVPSEAEIASHKYMLRAGMIRQLVSGVYSYLPLGLRVIRKVMDIVREEMDRAGAQEISMPAIQPAELWQETGRWEAYGPELMRLRDRHDRGFVLGPTHEEVVTSIARDGINSYKKLPVNLYQIQTKYRDEVRPRFGVIRSREFIMKDAYSFDVSRDGLDKSYQSMYDAYMKIFTRCGLNFRAVEADAGAIGGKGTHEFMALSDIGEDTIAYCESCDFAANLEKAVVVYSGQASEEQPLTLEKIETPNIRSIDQLVQSLDVSADKIIKSLLFKLDQQFVLALVRGDHELNDVKLKNLFDANVIQMASEEEVVSVLGSPVGFVGPLNLEEKNVIIVADHAVKDMANAVVGAGIKDFHYLNANHGRDFTIREFADLRNIKEGDACPQCGGKIEFARGIEVGHVFKLGTKYSEKMRATFLDENGKEQPMIMGCYGIGISRTVAAVVEQNNDEDGIIWPASIAPFQIHVVAVNIKSDDQRELAEQIYETLMKQGYEVLLDDRAERAGVKFKDADLIGLPIRITVGNKASDGIVECKVRKTKETMEISYDQLLPYLKDSLATL